jgi:hypothetical protein
MALLKASQSSQSDAVALSLIAKAWLLSPVTVA